MFLLFSLYSFSQITPTPQDSTSTGFSLGNINMPNPSSIESKYTYDPLTDRYIYTETVGSFNINYPIILTPEEFRELGASQPTLGTPLGCHPGVPLGRSPGFPWVPLQGVSQGAFGMAPSGGLPGIPWGSPPGFPSDLLVPVKGSKSVLSFLGAL